MGALKQSLIDTELEDQSDPREPGVYPGEPDNLNDLEEQATGFVMRDLTNAIATIKQQPEKFRSEYEELDKAQADIAEIVATLDKPF